MTSQDHISSIAEFAKHRDLVAFCGAGISLNSGLPLAQPLEKKIMQAMGADAESLSLLIEEMPPLESLLEHIDNFSGSIGLAEIISLFRTPELSPTSNHRAIALMGKLKLLSGIVTTNFDALLEQALAALEVDYGVYKNEEEFSGAFVPSNSETVLPVVKLHGCADDSRTRELGATLSRVAAGLLMPAKVDILTRIFSSGDHSAVLVLGYSCSDVFDVVPIVRNLQLKTKKIFFVEHLLADDVDLNAKKQRFEDMFNGFDAVWIHADTDELVASLLIKLRLDVPDYKRQSFDWRKPIVSWQKQAGSAVCSLTLGTLLSDIKQYQKALYYYQRALEQFDREQDRPVEDIFRESYHNVVSIDSMLHYLREGEVLTQSQFQQPYERRVRCLGLIGQAYKNLGDNQSALRYLTEAAQLGEQLGSAGAWLDSLGNVWQRLGDLARARSYHDRAIQEARKFQDEKSLVIRQCNLANVCSMLGETDQARTLYVEALDIAERIGYVKGKALVLDNLVVLCHNLGRYESANDFNEKALVLSAKLGDHAMNRRCLERSHNLTLLIAHKSVESSNREGSLVKLQKAISVEPDNATLHSLLGAARGDLGHHAQALEDWNTAVRLDPGQPSYYICRGTVLDHLGRSEEAISDYSRAIELAPDSAEAYYERGVTFRDQKELEPALKDFLRAIELNNQYHEAHICAAQVFALQGKLHEARQYALEAKKYGNPNAPHFAQEVGKQLHGEAVNRGLSQMYAGNLTESLRTYDQIIERDPEFAIAYNYRGVVQVMLRRYEQAMDDYARAVELDPTDASIYNNRANLYNAIGREVEAMREYDLAIQYSPETAEPYANKAAILANAGKWAEALPLFEQAAKLGNKQAAKLVLIARARLAHDTKPG
jgi:tetratricopeptide (TPR) repeat protein